MAIFILYLLSFHSQVLDKEAWVLALRHQAGSPYAFLTTSTLNPEGELASSPCFWASCPRSACKRPRTGRYQVSRLPTSSPWSSHPGVAMKLVYYFISWPQHHPDPAKYMLVNVKLCLCTDLIYALTPWSITRSCPVVEWWFLYPGSRTSNSGQTLFCNIWESHRTDTLGGLEVQR